jgi:putative redox protein
MENHINTFWKGGNSFESENTSGHTLSIDIDEAAEGEKNYRPKSLMLSALAGCSGLDVVSLFNKMKLEVDEFSMEIKAQLTDEHPKFYDKVHIIYHFHGSNLNEVKLARCVELSVDKYCGVAEMFRQFSKLTYELSFHNA